jgi:hypothetical protein
MPEQTFRSPGFFEQEIDLSARAGSTLGIPAGVIGTSKKGPAFVPVTIGTFTDFENRFGTLDPDRFGPYAVNEFLKHRNAVTFVRVLGAGANSTESDLNNTETMGIVKSAGFVLSASATDYSPGAVQFLCASQSLQSGELAGYPVFSDNRSFNERSTTLNDANLVRAVIFTTTGSRIEVLDYNQSYSAPAAGDSLADVGNGSIGEPYFKLVISSSQGASFSYDELNAGIRILTASLNPSSKHYIAKILNTNPDKFQEMQHLLYVDLPVENELATVKSVAILSGTSGTTTSGGDKTTPYRNLFGKFNTRYTTPKTTAIISQPFGTVEYDLFHFETISDGEATNEEYKVSIANIRKSLDPANAYGTFDVQIRRFTDVDTLPEILEVYPACNLNPKSENYIARKIGDKKVHFNFDTTSDTEQRLIVTGKYPNLSTRIRVVMNQAVENQTVPTDALPFGFRGIPVLKTSNSLTDDSLVVLSDRFGVSLGDSATSRLGGITAAVTPLSASILPPLPLRFKVTRGAVNDGTSTAISFIGDPGDNERADNRLYWGVKFERLPLEATVTNAVLNSNVSDVANPLVKGYAKFQGIAKLDTLVTGAAADEFNNNKFTLSRVALYNQLQGGQITDVTGTAREHMLEASYLRNGTPSATDYTINDAVLGANRITMATLVHSASSVFNRFQEFNKFTTMFYGGFDGVNLLDRDNRLLNDRASSSDTGGKAGDTYAGGLGLAGTAVAAMSGKGKDNNVVAAYQVATRLMTDEISSNVNVLAIPGIRDVLVTDFALDAVKKYGMAIYLMDVLNYDVDSNRLFDDSSAKPDVRETSEQFDARAINNNYGASYFPDVFLRDNVANRPVKVPASVAAMGALAFNDKIAYPWFAPAGFNRGALAEVSNVATRLNSEDRDVLYDSRINPIATFPTGGFVIFGQKTLQQAKSALDRVNVRRLLLEVKRLVAGVAKRLLFEQNDATTRAKFLSQVTPLLALIQSQSGIEQFQVVCDDTNNTTLDVEANRMNGRIVLVPTRVVEFISIDFIITNSGVSFE